MLMTLAGKLYGPLAPLTNFGSSPSLFNGSPVSDAASANWGAWATAISSVPYDLSGFEISDFSGSASGNGIDGATFLEVRYTLGGTSTTIVEQMPIGGLDPWRSLIFPIFVPHGASIEWRVRSKRLSRTFGLTFIGLQSQGGNGYIRPFQGCRCFGLDGANIRGTAVPSAAVGVYGTSTSLGATDIDVNAARLLPHWGGGITISTGADFFARVQRGVGGTELFRLAFQSNTSETVRTISNNAAMPMFLPSGTPLAVQAMASSGSATTLHYAVQGFYGAI